MEPWFGPRPGSNVTHSLWRPYQYVPKSREGWLILIAFYAAEVFLVVKLVGNAGEIQFAIGGAMIAIYLGFNWLASRHFG
jgi:hypothetical protein